MKNMKKFFLVLFSFMLTSAFGKNELYKDLQFSADGTCQKSFIVTLNDGGKDPGNHQPCDDIPNFQYDGIDKLRIDITGNEPISAIGFLYKGQNYYLTIRNSASWPSIGDVKCIVTLTFYNKLSSYDDADMPYAIVESVKEISDSEEPDAKK